MRIRRELSRSLNAWSSTLTEALRLRGAMGRNLPLLFPSIIKYVEKSHLASGLQARSKESQTEVTPFIRPLGQTFLISSFQQGHSLLSCSSLRCLMVARWRWRCSMARASLCSSRSSIPPTPVRSDDAPWPIQMTNCPDYQDQKYTMNSPLYLNSPSRGNGSRFMIIISR